MRQPGPDRAFVFQEFDQLFPWYTALGNVAEALKIARHTGRTEATDKARHFLLLMGIEHAAGQFPHTLSGGMKQRVAIAPALALEPDILLMDEPFGALDAIMRSSLQQELNAIRRETQVTIVFVTHSIEEAVAVGDRVIVMTPPPSRIRAEIDVRAVDDPADASASETLQALRNLLGSEYP